tara:strand:+ start:509 stop:1024 length:516 start_codon:yes stop_codon:yes gene_type:complete
MKNKFYYITFLLSISLYGCKTEISPQETPVNTPIEQVIETKETSFKNEFILNKATLKEIEKWTGFFEIDKNISNLKTEKPSIFDGPIEDLAAAIKDLNSKLPEQINTNSIVARIAVLATSSYQLNELYQKNTENKDVITQTHLKVLEAFSNLKFQINKTFEKQAQLIEKPE